MRYVVAASLSDTWSWTYPPLPEATMRGRTVTLTHRLGPESYERDTDEVLDPGLYLDIGPWAHHVFAVQT